MNRRTFIGAFLSATAVALLPTTAQARRGGGHIRSDKYYSTRSTGVNLENCKGDCDSYEDGEIEILIYDDEDDKDRNDRYENEDN